MAFVTGGWILAISLALAASDPATTVGLGRIGFAFASAIPVTLIWMVDSSRMPGHGIVGSEVSYQDACASSSSHSHSVLGLPAAPILAFLVPTSSTVRPIAGSESTSS